MDDEQRQRHIAELANVVRVLNGLLPAPPEPPQVHHGPGPAFQVNFQQFMMNQLYQEQLPQRIGLVFPQNPPIQNADFLIPVLQDLNQVAAAMQAPQPLFPAAQLPNLFNPGQAPVNVGAHFLNFLFPPPPPPPPPRQEGAVFRGLIEQEELVRQANPAPRLQRREVNEHHVPHGIIEPRRRRYGPRRRRVRPAPQNLNPAPQNLNPAPQNLNPAPQNLNPAPQNLNPAPQNLNPAPQNQGNIIEALDLIFQVVGPPLPNLNPAPQNVDPAPQNLNEVFQGLDLFFQFVGPPPPGAIVVPRNPDPAHQQAPPQ